MTVRSLLTVCAVLIGLVPASAQSAPPSPDRLQQVLDRKVLRVGTTMDTPVFSMRNAQSGELEGFDMDALATLGAALGVRIEYVKMTFGTMLPDLLADKFDIAMSGMGRTLERARVASFSRPYMRYGKLLVIRAADKDKYKTLEDLDKPGLKIAYNIGGLNDRFANTRFKQATPAGFPSNALAFADLVAGKVDAQVADSTSAVFLASKDPRVVAMSPQNVFDPVYVAILVRREDQTLLNTINIWLDQIEMEGKLAEIREKWLPGYPAANWPGEPKH